jgi:hypothetical protein
VLSVIVRLVIDAPRLCRAQSTFTEKEKKNGTIVLRRDTFALRPDLS